MNVIELNAGENTAEAARQAGVATTQADRSQAQADRSELAAQTTVAASRYFTSLALGEAGSTTGQLFSYDDGAGNLIFRKKTGGGSTEVARAVTPVTLQNYVAKNAGADIATDGGRFGLTSSLTPLGAGRRALFHVENEANDIPAGVVVTCAWEGSVGSPYNNNDGILVEVYNRSLSNGSNNFSWAGSFPNAYHDIPAGYRDGGTKYGLKGWATSVAGKPGYDHEGTQAELVGVWGLSGFQEAGTAATAKIEKAVGIRGQIVNQSSGTTIEIGVAGEFLAENTDGETEVNYALYALASGADDNWVFWGQAGRFKQNDQAIFGPGEYSDLDGYVCIRNPGNAVEFGFPDLGYGSAIGATASSGYPGLILCGGFGATGNTFRTRGAKGVTVTTDLAGALIFGRLTNANATGQSISESARFDADGRLMLAACPTYADNAAALAGGLAATHVYKTAAGDLRIVV